MAELLIFVLVACGLESLETLDRLQNTPSNDAKKSGLIETDRYS